MGEADDELGDVLPPIKLGGGKILNIKTDAAELSTYFCGCYRTARKVIMWNSIEQMSVDWHCFSSSITLKLQGGQVETFRVSRPSSLMSAASSIQKMRDMRRRSQDPTANDRHVKNIGLHDKVGITNAGLLVKRRAGFCQYTGLTLPWDTFVTAQLSPTWFGRREIIVTTQVTADEAEMLGNATPTVQEGLPKDADGVIHETRGATFEHLFENMIISWTGGRDYSEAAFDEVAYMMGAGDGEGESITTKTNNMTMTLGEAGIKVKAGKGGASRRYMPWSSVVSSSWRSPGCCWAPLMTLMDLNGNKVDFKSVSEEDFKLFSEKFAERAPQEPGWGGRRPRPDMLSASEAKPSEPRGVLDIQQGGVYIHRKLGMFGKESIFVPWSKVDSTRVQTSCMGGTAELLTTKGQAITVATSWSLARRTSLWAICRQMHELKYGTVSSSEDSIHSFNSQRTPCIAGLAQAARSCGCVAWAEGARQQGLRSEVNDCNVKLVLQKNYCSSFIREFDLTKIETCRVAEVNEEKFLVMKVKCAGDVLEVVTQPLDQDEDGEDIVQDIEARRKRKLSKGKIEDATSTEAGKVADSSKRPVAQRADASGPPDASETAHVSSPIIAARQYLTPAAWKAPDAAENSQPRASDADSESAKLSIPLPAHSLSQQTPISRVLSGASPKLSDGSAIVLGERFAERAVAGSLSEAVEARRAAQERNVKRRAERAERLLAEARTETRLKIDEPIETATNERGDASAPEPPKEPTEQ